jgi:hypothetical protein
MLIAVSLMIIECLNVFMSVVMTIYLMEEGLGGLEES